ncbi:hypothetical protein BJ742DRAFT_750180 [Cladochytrium replicatum]|nr:hypothetical protein BJ742DRAFT_750180 [Cladochytrium replicatum]
MLPSHHLNAASASSTPVTIKSPTPSTPGIDDHHSPRRGRSVSIYPWALEKLKAENEEGWALWVEHFSGETDTVQWERFLPVIEEHAVTIWGRETSVDASHLRERLHVKEPEALVRASYFRLLCRSTTDFEWLSQFIATGSESVSGALRASTMSSQYSDARTNSDAVGRHWTNSRSISADSGTSSSAENVRGTSSQSPVLESDRSTDDNINSQEQPSQPTSPTLLEGSTDRPPEYDSILENAVSSRTESTEILEIVAEDSSEESILRALQRENPDASFFWTSRFPQLYRVDTNRFLSAVEGYLFENLNNRVTLDKGRMSADFNRHGVVSVAHFRSIAGSSISMVWLSSYIIDLQLVALIREGWTWNHVEGSLSFASEAPTEYQIQVLCASLKSVMAERFGIAQIRALRLKFVKLRSTFLRSIADAVVIPSTLRELSLHLCQLGDEGCAVLAEKLKMHCSLEKLDLQQASIGDKGAIVLASSLSSTATLKVLDLSDNKIGLSGAVALADALTRNRSLIILRLNHNRITADGAAAFGRALFENTTLQNLGLAKNAISAEGASVIATGLVWTSSLRTINMSSNSLKDKGVIALADALKQNLSLVYLVIQNVEYGEVGLNYLAEALRANRSLVELDTRTEKGSWAEKLIDAGSDCKSLQRLRLSKVLQRKFPDEKLHSIITAGGRQWRNFVLFS